MSDTSTCHVSAYLWELDLIEPDKISASCALFRGNLANHAAAGDTGGVVTQQCTTKRHEVMDALIADTIEDLLALAPGLDQATPA
jgi:hypothetical protein